MFKQSAAWVLTGTFILTLAGLFFEHRKQKARERQYVEQRALLLADPVLKDLLQAGNEKCPENDTSFVWACGIVLRFEHVERNQLCSSHDSPRYTGSIYNRNKSQEIFSWVFETSYAYPDIWKSPCQDRDCTLVWLRGSGAQDDRTFYRKTPPSNVPPEPVWPDFESVSTYGTWQEGAWAAVDDTNVFFHFGQTPIGKMSGYRPPVSLHFHHPDLPLRIEMRLQHSRKDRWRRYVLDVIKGLNERVVSVDRSAQCDQPPGNVRFRLNPYSSRLHEFLEWKRSRQAND